MEFRVLGPVEAVHRDGPVKLGGPKQRAVLAHLLLRRNRVVSTERLIADVWGEQPPDEARNALQSYVSRLRGAIGHDRIEGRAPGYVLHASSAEVDAARFEELTEKARDLVDTDPATALDGLDRALSLWRGPPFADISGGTDLQAEVTRLEGLRLDAEERRIAMRLELGEHHEVIDELETLTQEHPFRERLWAHLMVALYRSGRQAEALAAYRRLRGLLVEELGIDPSPDLQDLELRILQHDPELAQGARTLRGFRLIEQIGAGHHGVVFRARQPFVERDVAVKVIRPALAGRPEFIRRFEAEAQVVARLEHPHIVPLYDFWRDPGGAHLVMRWMRGGSVRGLIDRRGAVDVPEAIRLMDQLCSGLDAAHRSGVVHRDLKPANLLLDEDGNVYLSDFGIAVDSLVDEPDSPPTASSGYLSPEQLRGEPATPRTDVYALGLLLYELLTGRHPYVHPEGVVRPPNGPLPSIAAARPELPTAIDDVVQRAAAEDPAARHDGPLDLAADLRKRMGGETRPALVVPLRNPYRGLQPFEQADSACFFGRDALLARVIDRLGGGEDGARFLALVGPSGSGKSSLVSAGLIPAVRAGALPGSDGWMVARMLPGSRPFDALETVLGGVAATDAAGLGTQARRSPHRLPQFIAERLPGGSELLLVIDQFEELFSMVEDEADRLAFLDALHAAAQDDRGRIRIVVVLRADFYDRPLLYQRFGQMLAERTETVTPLSPDELERAIVGPAQQVGVSVEPLLVARAVSDVADQPGALPLLQYALTEVFHRRENGQLTLAGYQAAGGVSGALARRAEDIFRRLDEAGKRASRQLFLRLVAADENAEDARRRVTRAELATLEVDQRTLAEVVEAFGTHRLLTFDRDPRSRAPTVEVAHEALFREWGRLRGWLDSAGADVRTRKSLAAMARDWEENARDPSFLLTGNRLDQFDSWARSSMVALTRAEREYLDVSLDAAAMARAQEAERKQRESTLEQRSVRRLRAVVVLLVVGAAVAVGLSLLALHQRERARHEARLATARELAAAAEANLDADPDLAINLALAAVAVTRDSDGTVVRQAEEALHTSLQATRVATRLPGLRGVAFTPDGRAIVTAPESGVAFHDPTTGRVMLRLDASGPAHLAVSPAGSVLAVAGRGPLVSLFDIASGEQVLTMVSETGSVEPVAFSPDGTLLAGLTLEGTAVVWDIASGVEVARVAAGGGWGLGFSPDGQVLAVPMGDETALHEMPSGREVGRIPGGGRNVSFSPDGALVATTGFNGEVSLWDFGTVERLHSLAGHEGHVNALTFSPDGRIVATGGNDGIARLWDVEGGEQLMAISGQRASVDHLAFSPDGALLASGGSTGTLVWDITPTATREVAALAAHGGLVLSVTYSPDGSRIATAGADGLATIWDAETRDRLLDLAGHDGPVTDVVFNRDGSMLATSSSDGTAKLWGASGNEVRTLVGHTAPVWGVTFSPDGERVATVGEDGTGRVWEVETGETVVIFRGHTDFVYDAAWSPDGSMVVSVSNDFAGRTWDPSTGEEVAVFAEHDENIVELAFSPDGSQVASAGFDGVARVWEPTTGEQMHGLRGHGGSVLDVESRPDGSGWATTSLDGTIRLWDGETGLEVLTLDQSPPAGRLAFSPDGTRLAAGTLTGLLRILTLDVDELVELAMERKTRPLTDEECTRYLHTDGCVES